MKVWIPWALLLVAFTYNILDVHHTKLLLSVGATEINPLMNYVIQKHGVNSLYGVKIIAFLLLSIFMLLHQIQFTKKERENEAQY